MSRLTLRLPATLHHQLEELAHSEAISLNQYIVFALTRQVTLAYTVQSLPDKAVSEQRASYTALLQSLGEESFSEVQKTLNERRPAKLERGLTPETVQRLKKRIRE